MSQNDNSKKPGFVEWTIGKVRDAGASALRGLADRLEVPKATFEIADTKIDFGVDVAGDTLWATQAQMAELFGKGVPTINEHLANAYKEREISREATIRKFRTVREEGGRQVERDVEHYNLDAILAVGMRVRSPRATEFRQWAFRILKEYVVHGYALNEKRLRDDPVAAQSLAEKVREIRFDEKNLYSRVRACVAAVASDYDPASDLVRAFFARMQDKFHWAACEQTAQDLLLSRADASRERMGMTTQLNARPTLKDAETAKNYLSEHELKLQMVAGDAFFAYVENMMLRDKSLTTAQLLSKIDEVFKFNEMPVFPGYRGFRGDQAKKHVKVQYDLFKSRSAQQRYNDARGLPPS
ncbi:RhuM family protein [Methylobacterium sp. WL9]|uniref:RhuM family protein n=1 Tax=Methylobacterium sp. WL9 TaxID=2603898 RepID=UPI001FEDCF19|nr:RhuM family protein [Methylobacterium sp. WL9]